MLSVSKISWTNLSEVLVFILQVKTQQSMGIELFILIDLSFLSGLAAFHLVNWLTYPRAV